jgi:hypothetical protein
VRWLSLALVSSRAGVSPTPRRCPPPCAVPDSTCSSSVCASSTARTTNSGCPQRSSKRDVGGEGEGWPPRTAQRGELTAARRARAWCARDPMGRGERRLRSCQRADGSEHHLGLGVGRDDVGAMPPR